MFCVAGAPAPAPGPGGTYNIREGVKGVYATLWWTRAAHRPWPIKVWFEAEWVEVKCVHSDIHRYPVVSLVLKFKGKKHRVKAVVSPRLWHPLILGTNWPGFHGLLGEYAGMRSQPVDV